jgi:hypothetical protein
VLSGENGEYLRGCLRLLACGEYRCASVSKAGAAGAAGTVRSDDINIVHDSSLHLLEVEGSTSKGIGLLGCLEGMVS